MLKRKLIPQNLPTVTPKYDFNSDTNELEEVGITDDFALVQSSADTAFKKILERLGYFDSPQVELYDPTKVKFVDDTPVTDNLEEVGYTSYADFLEKLQDYADKRNLPATYSPEQIVADMRAHSAELKKNIEKELKENEKQKDIVETDK